MNHTSSHRKRLFLLTKTIYSLTAIFLILYSGAAVSAEPLDGTHSFKMVSTIEYSGKGQFRNQAETLHTVQKKELSGDMVSYTISPKMSDVTAGWEKGQSSLTETISFVVDRRTRRVLTDSKALSLLENVNNQCVRSITKQDRENLGKTWKQTFNIRVGDYPFPEELTFDLKSLGLETYIQGEVIAVRALSKPFTLNVTDMEGKTESIKCKIGTVYLFDSQLENIYLSVSVFEATTKMNGYKELLRHEIATYLVDADGTAVDLSGLSKDFEKLVRKLGLRTKELKVVKEAPLPAWARTDAVKAAQAANICASTACEGASNPVITVCAASGKMIELQSQGKITPSDEEVIIVSKELVSTVPGTGDMKIAVAPAFMGIGVGTAGLVAGGTVAIAAGVSGGGGGDRSPQ